jgi:hypothetical protein
MLRGQLLWSAGLLLYRFRGCRKNGEISTTLLRHEPGKAVSFWNIWVNIYRIFSLRAGILGISRLSCSCHSETSLMATSATLVFAALVFFNLSFSLNVGAPPWDLSLRHSIPDTLQPKQSNTSLGFGLLGFTHFSRFRFHLLLSSFLLFSSSYHLVFSSPLLSLQTTKYGVRDKGEQRDIKSKTNEPCL